MITFHLTHELLSPFIAACIGRCNDYALQEPDGRYRRQGQPLSYELIAAHLAGVLTIGTYVIDESGLSRFAVFDSDTATGLADLAEVQLALSAFGVSSYLERSRLGRAHLWTFFAQPLDPREVRASLLPFCPPGVEFYPKQDALSPTRPYGSLIRLPLGVHKRSGERYPFVAVHGSEVRPLFTSLSDALSWFATIDKATVLPVPPPFPTPALDVPTMGEHRGNIPFMAGVGGASVAVKDWCRQHDPFEVIGRYVSLDAKGMGCCPFGTHHSDGVDSHASLWVYRPTYPDVCCWYCHVWQAGGSLFDFLRYYYGLAPRELWQRILSGARF